MKILNRILAVALCIFMVTAAGGCHKNAKEDIPHATTMKYEELKLSSTYEGSGVAAENQKWRLHWDSARKQVSFEEINGGVFWSPTPAETSKEILDEDGMPVKVHPQVDSALMVYYHNPVTQEEKVALSSTDAAGTGNIYTQSIKNGLRVIYDFSELEIAVPVDYTIDDERFLITVKPQWIADNGESYVTAVAIAPFLCGIENNRQDAWLFLPDGSGALLAPNETDSVGTTGMTAVYGEDKSVQSYSLSSYTSQVHMPVYGVKKGENALLSVIDSGDESASLAYNIGSQNTKYSSVYPFFRIRGYRLIEAPESLNSPLTEIKVFSNEISTSLLRIAGYPLSGKAADVLGMADVYRNYLIKHHDFSESQQEEKSAAFKFVGAVQQPDFFLGIPTKKLFPLTTVSQAQAITKSLEEALGSDFLVSLTGFGQSGIDIGKIGGGFTTASSLGGQKALHQFSKTLSEMGISWYKDFEMIYYNKSSSGFSKRADSAVMPNGEVAWQTGFDPVSRMPKNDRFYMLSRGKTGEAAKKLIDSAKANGILGVSLDSLSRTVYSDYSAAETSVGGNTANSVRETIRGIRKSKLLFLANSPNVYAGLEADYIIDAPLYSSGFDVSFADVPFYEMVYKGFIPMSSVSLNLCADETDALLRCVEAGISPSYTLINNFENELITNAHSFIFSSVFEGNKDRIIKNITRITSYLEDIKGAKIKKYSQMGEVRVTEYDNGVFAAVNFGDQEAASQFGKIPPKEFITGKR